MHITKLFKPYAFILYSVLALSACGGDDNSDSKTLTGVFIDAPVQGLGYQTPSHQGTTNAKGEFSYQADEAVTFFFNGIDLGSAPAQSKFPVTLLPNSPKLAQIFQTLDHNADPDKIDVSGITLDATLKTQLQNIISDKAGTPGLKDILTDAKLAELQASNNVTLVNQTLVDEDTVANHLLNNIEPVAFKRSDLAKKLILDGDGGEIDFDLNVITFDASGTGEFLTNGFFELERESFSWSLDNNGSAKIVLSEGTAIATKLGESGNRSATHIDDGDDKFLREWRTALPLELADLNGKHFLLEGSDNICGTTFSFSGDTAIENSRCEGDFVDTSFDTSTYLVSNHNLLDNVVVLTLTQTTIAFLNPTEGTFKLQLALIDGSLAEGKYVLISSFVDTTDSEFDSSFSSVVVQSFSETNAPLTAP